MRYLLFVLLIAYLNVNAQDYAIGSWRSHFPLNKSIDVVQSDKAVYCASNSGIIILDKEEKNKSVLTKAEGLMDVDITSIYFNDDNNNLIIGYQTGGIDIYNEGSITSILDIVRSSILGSKKINDIKKFNDLLYLCTDFGVVVFDDNKMEVKETYYIGSNGNIAVNDMEIYGDSLYVATEEGIYAANRQDNLSNNVSWEQQNLEHKTEKYSSIFIFKDVLYANLYKEQYYSDTLYRYVNNIWEKTNMIGSRNKSFYVTGDSLIVSKDYGISILDSALNTLAYIYQYETGVGPEPANVILDKKEKEFTLWCADKRKGLVKNVRIWTSEFYDYDMPASLNVNKIEISDNTVWMTSGGVKGSQWQNVWMQEGIAYYDGIDWNIINKGNTSGLDTVFDYLDIAVDPTDPNHVFVTSLGDGLLEFQDGELTEHFTDKNSTLQHVEPASSSWYWIGVTSAAFDSKGNLWATNHSVDKILSVYDTDGNWNAIDVRSYTQNSITGDLLLTSTDQAWLVFPKSQGILIYDANQTISDLTDDNAVVLTQNYGLPSNTVYAIAEDLDGEVWIGTDKGIAVVYAPQSIFSGGDLEAKQILIEQDGYTEYLLENNSVSSIAVDGADRKWVGTRNAGAFLLSSDGTEEILHFTETNSPLPSNEIKTIAVNNQTGEVFFGTEKGIISYRGEATSGYSVHSDVKVYPNPVRETYSGPIAISGLAQNSNVKITDVSGNLVYETQALGAQAIWYGNDVNGNRVATGIYLVFSVSEDGSDSYVTKILFIN